MTKDYNNNEHTVSYVFIPDEGIYGTVVREGAWYSIIEYYDGGIQYRIEVPNEDFIVIDEIGLGYIDETDDNL
jgi:hypothetical protein